MDPDWQELVVEAVLEVLEDLEARPEAWEGEAWIAGVSVGELLEEVVVLAVAEAWLLAEEPAGQVH